MVLIKRVVLAAAMSLLSEGAIAGVTPTTTSTKAPPVQPTLDERRATAEGDASTQETR